MTDCFEFVTELGPTRGMAVQTALERSALHFPAIRSPIVYDWSTALSGFLYANLSGPERFAGSAIDISESRRALTYQTVAPRPQGFRGTRVRRAEPLKFKRGVCFAIEFLPVTAAPVCFSAAALDLVFFPCYPLLNMLVIAYEVAPGRNTEEGLKRGRVARFVAAAKLISSLITVDYGRSAHRFFLVTPCEQKRGTGFISARQTETNPICWPRVSIKRCRDQPWAGDGHHSNFRP